MQIQGSVVLITGASEGIGAACVESFRTRGARLVLVSRRMFMQDLRKQLSGLKMGFVLPANNL
jgi:short-subunit dehydrogenase